MYRVRKSWEDAVSQKGAFHELENAKKCADANKGYAVFNTSGKQVYPKTDFSPYLVEVTATDLNIRKGPGDKIMEKQGSLREKEFLPYRRTGRYRFQ